MHLETGDMDDDSRLFRRLRGGDPEALRAIYEKYKKDLLRVAACLLTDLGLAANIELKSEGDGARPLAAAVVAVITRAWPADRAPPLLSSFDTGCVAACRDLAPAVPRAFLVEAPDRAALAAARRLDCMAIHANHRRLNEKLTTMVKNEGWRCAAYTVDDPARAKRLLAWGVDSIITNAPDRLKAALDAAR